MPIGRECPAAPGHTIDWELLRRRRSNVPLILAGGLTPENVGEAIDLTRPGAVDVASGVESAPGIKDHELMTAFAAAAEEAGGPSGPPPLHEPDHFVESMEKDIAEREAEAARLAAEREEDERAEAAPQAEAPS